MKRRLYIYIYAAGYLVQSASEVEGQKMTQLFAGHDGGIASMKWAKLKLRSGETEESGINCLGAVIARGVGRESQTRAGAGSI